MQQVLESISRVFGLDDSGAGASKGARPDDRVFLSMLPPRAGERRLALLVVALSVAVFAIATPFAKVQLARVEAFIPAYQAALALSDLITAVLLFGQFSILRSPGLRLLACAYLFTALMVVVHTLSFPGLFAPTGLLGAGPQTTAWIYMFWHGGFPLLVLGYARFNNGDRASMPGGAAFAILTSIAGVLATVIFLTLLVTTWQAVLPPIMDGNHYTPLMIGVVSAVWLLSLAALIVLWRRRPRSVLDLWLMVVMCAWLFDIALSAVLNAGRFDLGFYAGRIYGLLAANFVLLVLLLETRALHARLARTLEAERRAADRRAQDLQEINRALQLSEDELRFVNDALEQRVVQRTKDLHASEARYRQVVDLIPDAIWIHSEGKLTFVNPFAVRMFGARSADELVGRPIMGLIHPDDLLRAMERTQLLMEQRAVPSTEMRLLKLNGKPMIASLHATQFLRDGKVHVLVAGRDITEQKEASAQLHQAQKMESVGQLTGGVAHDFNNLLTVIIGNLELIAERAPAEDRAGAQSALRAAERGAALIRQMLAFSRRQLLLPEAIRLNDVVAGMEDMLRRTLGEDIEIEMKLAVDSWPAMADKGQVENALLNFAVNARDAMEGGGKLTIETGNARLDEDYADHNTEVAPGDYAMLAVSDTGTGMPPEVIARAFEPFFTTKAHGKGTGLGLSMIYGFAKQSGGHLKIYSEVGHGTTMRLYLPRHNSAAGAVVATHEAVREQPRGGETILLVEDDELVRAFTASQLRGLGYHVLEATDGPAALRVLDSGAAVDMIFTDVVMPGGMTGKQLADAAQQKRPGLKTLYTSGYTENTIVHRGKLDPGVHFLSKPFRRQELALKVREVLDAAP